VAQTADQYNYQSNIDFKAKSGMPPTIAADVVDKLHYIDLEDGKFTDHTTTTAKDLTDAFNNFDHSPQRDQLCVFFHGGLRSRADALKTAGWLIDGYTKAGAYPFFFVWNSDLLDVLKTCIRSYGNDPFFVTVANYTVKTVARKISAALDKQKSLKIQSQISAKPQRAAPQSLEQLASFAKRYDGAWTCADAQLGCSSSELDQFALFLVAAEKASPVKHRRFKREKLQGRDNPLWRILHRFNTCHDHGLYTTVIEELLIAWGLDEEIGQPIWRKMKTFINHAFDSDPAAGGTAFADHLCAMWRPTLRVTLIGHSAGAIYVQRMIEALNARLPEGSMLQVEVILLAAAMSFARMNEGLSVLRKRVGALRVFGLNDQTESQDHVIEPPVYDKSLLYLVSSLCEDDPNADKPLVGMQRYWKDAPPYCDPEILAVTKFIGTKRSVWSPTQSGAKPGYRSHANHHGTFPVDPPDTNVSVCFALKHGF
jgi:hypothetical protein